MIIKYANLIEIQNKYLNSFFFNFILPNQNCLQLNKNLKTISITSEILSRSRFANVYVKYASQSIIFSEYRPV